MSVHREHDSWRRRQAEERHAQALGRFAAKREELAALFDIDLLADPGPPASKTVLEPVRGQPDAFDVSCQICGVIERFKAMTFQDLIWRMRRAGWRVGARTGWTKPGEALHDLRTFRACSDCAEAA